MEVRLRGSIGKILLIPHRPFLFPLKLVMIRCDLMLSMNCCDGLTDLIDFITPESETLLRAQTI